MTRFVFILFLLVLSLPAFAQQSKGASAVGGSEIAATGNRRAVVIGISGYQDSGIPKLQYAHRDAEAFAEFLQSYAGGRLDEDRVELITNEKATVANIYAKLDWLLETVQEGEQAVIYFSGHGDVETKTSRNRGFLLAYDTPPNNYRIGALRVDDLNDILETLVSVNKAKVLLISDACRSGKLAGGKDGAAATSMALAQQFQNEIKLLSCQPTEESLEGEQWGGGRGAFSFHLIDGLTGMADENNNGEVNLFEIDRYLMDHVPEETDQKQFPNSTGSKGSILSLVDSEELAELMSERNGTTSGLTAIRSKGRDDEVLVAKADTSVQRLYGEFIAAINDKYFLPSDRNGERQPGKSASELYDVLSGESSLKPLHGTMKRNFAVALQDDAQQSINAYLKADPEELEERWSRGGEKYKSNPAYLDKAAGLLGESHYLHDQLVAKKYYFEGLLLRLEGEEKQDESLFNQALEKQKQALERDDAAAYIYNEMGLIFLGLRYLYAAAGDTEKVKEMERAQLDACQKAMDIAPAWAMPYNNAATILRMQRKLDEAEQMGLKAIERDTTLAVAYSTLGLIYQLQEKYTEAIEMYRKAIACGDTHLFLYNDLGYNYFLNGQFDKAEDSYLKAIAYEPSERMPYYNLGGIYFQQQAYDKAKSLFLQLLQHLPGEYTACYNLACLAALQDRPEQALDWLEKALEAGYRDYKHLMGDPDLEGVRGLEGFEELTERYFGEKGQRGDTQVEPEKQKESDKIQAELKELDDAIKKIVKHNINAPKPTVRTDSIQEYEKEILNKECDGNIVAKEYKFELDFIEDYPNSSNQTKRFDGAVFCIYELPVKVNNSGKIVYRRNEGGHLSDQLILVTSNQYEQKVNSLPLISHYSKEGYDKTIESEFWNPNKIKRIIIERLGWKYPNDTDGDKQPRSETTQIFEIQENGEIKLVMEKVENYNFEKYLED